MQRQAQVQRRDVSHFCAAVSGHSVLGCRPSSRVHACGKSVPTNSAAPAPTSGAHAWQVGQPRDDGSCRGVSCSSCRSHSLCSCHSSTHPAASSASVWSAPRSGLGDDCAVLVSRTELSAGWKLILLTGAGSLADASFRPYKRALKAASDACSAFEAHTQMSACCAGACWMVC